MKIIAHIKTEFSSKFGAPRQSGILGASVGKIIFEEEYRDPSALRGLEEFSHIWVLWEFSKAKPEKWSPTVRPPLLGGNKRMGVFATRSPFRPNPVGLSALKLERIEKTEDEGCVLLVSGCDMVDGTPIFDIKPYLPYCDSIPNARAGFTETLEERALEVEIPDNILKEIPKEKQKLIIDVLKGDPRPSYQNDETRVYGFQISGLEIRFRVEGKTLTVISAEKPDLADKNIEKEQKR